MGKHGKNQQKTTEPKFSLQSPINSNPSSNNKEQKTNNLLKINLQSTSPPKKVRLFDLPQEYNIEEKHSNKFDMHYPRPNRFYNKYESRKCSKDSTSDSVSLEDFLENDYNNNNLKINNNKYNQKSKFKSQASDFKIKYKTELCKYFEINGYCKFGDNCAYAHGIDNLRSKVTNSISYRTRKCVQFFENGYCPYGNRCQFAHQLKSNIINNPYDRKMTYKKIMETISKIENVKNIKSLIEKSRLSVFEDIVQNPNQAIKSTLLEDIKEIRKEDIYERIDNNDQH